MAADRDNSEIELMKQAHLIFAKNEKLFSQVLYVPEKPILCCFQYFLTFQKRQISSCESEEEKNDHIAAIKKNIAMVLAQYESIAQILESKGVQPKMET